MNTRPDLAWAAGFYEGEGSVTAARGGTHLILSIGQVDPEPLHRFARIVGTGTVRVARDGAIWVYRCHGRVAQRVLMAMWPDLSQRRQNQALRALCRYVQRTVRDPDRCRRGHFYAEAGKYKDRHCLRCRADNRQGKRAAVPPLPTAIAIRFGIREYNPAVLQT